MWESRFLRLVLLGSFAPVAACEGNALEKPGDASSDARIRRDAGRVEPQLEDADTRAFDADDGYIGSIGCVPGITRCRGQSPAYKQVCAATGEWAYEPCPLSQEQCVGGGECRKVVCESGLAFCSDAGAQARTACSDDQTQWRDAACPDGTRCVQLGLFGQCHPMICTPGETGCVSGGVGIGTCATDGLAWQVTTPCDDTATCQKGKCETFPAPTASSIVVLSPDSRPSKISLVAGTYALALVNVDTADDELIALPLTIVGNLSGGPLLQAETAPERQTETKPREPVTPRCLTGLTSLGQRSSEWKNADHLLGRPVIRAAPEQVGDKRYFHPYGIGTRKARLAVSGTHVNLWEDVTEPNLGMAPSIAEEVVLRLDTGAIPRLIALFGQPTDVDKNGKIDLFATPTIQEYGGFVQPWHTLYGSSDFGEVVYSAMLGDAASYAMIAAHEIEHLIYFGRRFKPPAQPPNWPHAEVYATEGIAELAAVWSGQGPSDLVGLALATPDTWSVARFFGGEYLKQGGFTATRAAYGHGAIWLDYLFEQHGAAEVSGEASVVDTGGVAFLKQFTDEPYGWNRLRLKDGRSGQEGYVDLGAALLISSLPDAEAATYAANNPRYRFLPYQEDARWGGALGIPLHGEVRGARIARRGFGTTTTMRRGGMKFFDLRVGPGGAIVERTDSTTGLVLVRRADGT